MAAQDKATIATRVPAKFAEAVTYFAHREKASVSRYTRAALARRASGSIKEQYEENDRIRRMAGLMKAALENGSWEKLAAESPDVYPATREEWIAKITNYEATSGTIIEDIKEMDAKLKEMGVVVLG